MDGGRYFGPAGYVAGYCPPHMMPSYHPPQMPFFDARRGRVSPYPYSNPYLGRGRNGGQSDWARQQAERIRAWHKTLNTPAEDHTVLTPAEDLGLEEDSKEQARAKPREEPKGKAPRGNRAGAKPREEQKGKAPRGDRAGAKPGQDSGQKEDSRRGEPGLALRGEAAGKGIQAEESDEEEEEEACMAPCSDHDDV